MATTEELRRQIVELKRAKAVAEARVADEKCGREAAEARVAPTRFLDYLRGIEQHLRMAMPPWAGPAVAENAAATVEGKFYPQRFRRWTDFQAKHNATFAQLRSAFGEDALFPPLFSLEEASRARSRAYSPACAQESDLRYFFRAAIEEPAATVVNHHLKRTKDATVRGVQFPNKRGCALFFEPGALPAERPSPEINDLSDRWLVADRPDGRLFPVLIREYTSGLIYPHTRTLDLLARWQREDFVLRVAEAVETGGGGANELSRATAVCRAYHGMLTAGLEFGYVAAADGLLLLRVPEDDPNTLYYCPIAFRDDPNAHYHCSAQRPQILHMAYLTTLCLSAIESTARPRSWIKARDGDVKRWPKRVSPPVLAPDQGLGGREGPSGTGEPNALKRPSDAAEDAAGDAPKGGQPPKRTKWTCVVEPPMRPYCTQACLRGLRDRKPLDNGCPNVALHRAARATDNADTDADADSHPLTMDDVQTRIVAQLAANMDKDCQCLDAFGCAGRHGVLFRLAVTGTGYTFVGKGVQSTHRDVLVNEAACYEALAAFQGRLLPVCLGRIKLVHAIPLPRLAAPMRVRYLLLLSYGGRDIEKAEPVGVDWLAEKARTLAELEAAGMWPDEVRRPNLCWNDEVRRVMRIDLGVATVTRPAAVVAEDPAKKAQDDKAKEAATADAQDDKAKEAAKAAAQDSQTKPADGPDDPGTVVVHEAMDVDVAEKQTETAAVVQDEKTETRVEAAGRMEANEADAVAPEEPEQVQAAAVAGTTKTDAATSQ